MKKINVAIIVLIFIFFSNSIFASTIVVDNLETNQEMSNLINISSPLNIISIPFGFFGTFINGFLIVIGLYCIITIVCKVLINSKRSFKTYLSYRKLGKIMDRMYEYKREG